MEENKFPKKDSKGRDITPHITKPIVQAEEVKDSPFKKAAKLFFSEDIDHVTDSIVDEFVKPRTVSFGKDLVRKTKEFFHNSLTDFIDAIFYGNNRNNSSYTSYSKYGKGYNGYSSSYSYNSYYNTEPDNYYYYNGAYHKDDQPHGMVRHDIVRERPIKEEGKSKDVINNLRHVIRVTKDHCVSVADYYVAVGVHPSELDQLDYEYVWTGSMLDGCKPRWTRRGFVLDLPNPIPKP